MRNFNGKPFATKCGNIIKLVFRKIVKCIRLTDGCDVPRKFEMYIDFSWVLVCIVWFAQCIMYKRKLEYS